MELKEWIDISTALLPLALIALIGWLLAIVKELLPKVSALEKMVSNINQEQKEQGKRIQEIREALIAKGMIGPLLQNHSPKQITNEGHALLRKYHVDKWMGKCPLVQNFEQFKDREELDIYLAALKYVDGDGRRKLDEILYEEVLNADHCRDFLAVAIRDKILDSLKKTAI